MTQKNFFLEIITPGKVVYSGEAIRLQAPSTAGYFEILYNHTPFLSALKTGKIKVTAAAGKKYFAISGGFAEVYKNKVIVLAETAEPSEEIEVNRALAAKQRAEHRLLEHLPETDIPRARVALVRALNRLSVARLGK